MTDRLYARCARGGRPLFGLKNAFAEVEAPRRSSEKWCPKCTDLRAAYDAASKKYTELKEEQVSTAGTSLQRSWLLDPLLEIAIQHRKSAESAVEFHRVLDHGKEHRTMRRSANRSTPRPTCGFL